MQTYCHLFLPFCFASDVTAQYYEQLKTQTEGQAQLSQRDQFRDTFTSQKFTQQSQAREM